MRLARRSLIFSLVLAACVPAALAETGHGKEGEGKSEAPESREIARSIELRGLVFPVFEKNGKLDSYLFVNARMLVGPGKDPWKYREKAHFIRDAVIRAAHRTSFNVEGDHSKLDEDLAQRECLKAANDMLGEPDALVSMTFTQIDTQVGR
ncbi:MAG: hypothetical protein GC155_09570 [Alphaproteobacteria bacterium]|nr:hypothetical protein [Alphaproteobacteria bacterium]